MARLAVLAILTAFAVTVDLASANDAPLSATPPDRTAHDAFYYWEVRSFKRATDFNFTGMTPTHHFLHGVGEVKLPFTFPFYSRPQRTIFVDPVGFIFPHRVSAARCPQASCRHEQQRTSYIAPLLDDAAGHGTEVRVFVHQPAVHVVWSYLSGSSCSGQVTATCRRVEFSATLYESGEIMFQYFNLPQLTGRPSIGLRDSVVEGGYGTMSNTGSVRRDILSTIELNANDQLLNALTPVSIRFSPEQRPIKPRRQEVNASIAGASIVEDCHNVSTLEECNRLGRQLFCFWCTPVADQQFDAFCGRRDDQDPLADIIFNGGCQPVKESPEPASPRISLIPSGNQPPQQQQQQGSTENVQAEFTSTLLGSDFYTVSHSASQFQRRPSPDTYRLNTRYTGRVNQQIILPFDMPFYQRNIHRLTLSSDGVLYVDAQRCPNCHDLLHESPLLNSHIAPLTGVWSFNRMYAPVGETSSLSRYDAIDNSFVHFEWANARMVQPTFECPALHCQRCFCPIRELPPFTFSVTLYRDGTIAFNYPNIARTYHDLHLNAADLGQTSVGDVLTVLEPEASNGKPNLLHYQTIDGTALQEESEDFLRSIIITPKTNAPSCNSAQDVSTCQQQTSPCLWCETSSRYVLRDERSFCSAASAHLPANITSHGLSCRYFRGEEIDVSAVAGGSVATIAGSTVGALVVVALAVVGVVYLVKRHRGAGNVTLPNSMIIGSTDSEAESHYYKNTRRATELSQSEVQYDVPN